jgi:hypothetical protein
MGALRILRMLLRLSGESGPRGIIMALAASSGVGGSSQATLPDSTPLLPPPAAMPTVASSATEAAKTAAPLDAGKLNHQLKQTKRRLRSAQNEANSARAAAKDIKAAAKDFKASAEEIKTAAKDFKDSRDGAAAMAAAAATRAELDKKPLGTDLNADKKPIRDEKDANIVVQNTTNEIKKEPESHLGAQLAGLAEAGVIGALAYNYVPWSSIPSATVAAAQATPGALASVAAATPGALATVGGALATGAVATGSAIATAAPVVAGAIADTTVAAATTTADAATLVADQVVAANNTLKPVDFATGSWL